MANIYRQDNQQLHELLDRASGSIGATLLIPDLQRPYVWTPKQVTLLVDSLIRGWPFGTLLLWKVNHLELQYIPYRSFSMTVDRTVESDGGKVPKMDPPADFHMVLDGQQRVQSLLLALGSDDWGFKLEDKDWTEEINERRPRGRQSKYRHWSKASLCFDLKTFLAEYQNQENRLLAVDFRKVLKWIVIDPQNGQSSFPTPKNYKGPLHLKIEHVGRYIRMGRLWQAAKITPGLKEADFRNHLKPILLAHDVQADSVEKLLLPLGELMTTLREVKVAEVTFLELQPFDEAAGTKDAYNDAIVNIFTRLNSGGRTLTKDEITLAWLKIGWQENFTEGKTAGVCFNELLGDLKAQKLDLEMDELVRAASFAWAIAERQGRLLANSDLLKGDVIRPMAEALSRRWLQIRTSFISGATILKDRGYEYGPRGHFSSLYELAVLFGWLFTAEVWQVDHKLDVMQKHNFETRCDDSVGIYIDRWIMCSQWAGKWSNSSGETGESYAKRLAEASKSFSIIADWAAASLAWAEAFRVIVDESTTEAIKHLDEVEEERRERVSAYYNYLWIWHRLDSKRWTQSQEQLRRGKSKVDWEVDHTVSFALWKRKLQDGLPTGITDMYDAENKVNGLGNCALLFKNFNISKSDQSIRSFLSNISKFNENAEAIDEWASALVLSEAMLDPDQASVDEICKAIADREKAIKAELSEFVRGERVRADIPTASAAPPLPSGTHSSQSV